MQNFFFFLMAANINKCNHCLGKCNKIQGLNMLSNPVILILELRDKIQAFLSCIYFFYFFFERVTFFWMWIWNIYFQIQYIVFLYLDLLTLFKMSNVYLKVFFFFFLKTEVLCPLMHVTLKMYNLPKLNQLNKYLSVFYWCGYNILWALVTFSLTMAFIPPMYHIPPSLVLMEMSTTKIIF